MNFTKGPWKVGRAGSVVSDNSNELEMIGATGSDAIDYYGGNLICESVSASNAKLIALTPEMFEALQSIATGCISDNKSAKKNLEVIKQIALDTIRKVMPDYQKKI